MEPATSLEHPDGRPDEPPGPLDPVEALVRLGGIAGVGRWRSLTGRAAARDALASGAVVRLRRHQVGLAGVDEARRLAAETGGVLSHLSAAQHHGWKLKAPPAAPMLTVPRAARLPAGCDGLADASVRWGAWRPDEVVGGVTSPLRTVVDCARHLPLDVALAVADSALRDGAVTREGLLAAARSSPRNGRARAVRVVDLASPLAANPFESVLRAVAVDVPGLSVRPQGWIGTAGRSDLVDDALRIALEADSWEFHGSQDAFRHDVRRYTEFARRGWVVLRFLWEDVMHHPERVRAVLVETVAVRRRQLGLPMPAARAG